MMCDGKNDCGDNTDESIGCLGMIYLTTKIDNRTLNFIILTLKDNYNLFYSHLFCSVC